MDETGRYSGVRVWEIGELQTKLSQNIIGISNKYFMNLLMSFLSKIGQLMRYF